jgi:gas vesicle protein
MRNSFETNLAFLLGGALLGGVAVAFATPYSGRRMRHILRHALEDCTDQVTEATQDLRETGGQLRHEGEKLVREAERLFARVPAITHS